MARKITKKLVKEALEYVKQDLLDRFDESLSSFTYEQNDEHRAQLEEDWFWFNEEMQKFYSELENIKIK